MALPPGSTGVTGMPTFDEPPGGPVMSDAEMARAADEQATIALLDSFHGGSGIPIAHRAIVAGEGTADRKAAALADLGYRDVTPYPNGQNFVMRHPTDDTWQVYNPGMQFNTNAIGGALASLGPDVAEMVGGALTGAVPAGLAVATRSPAAAALASTAYGVGSAAGKELYTSALRWLGGTQDRRTMGEAAMDVGTTAALNAIAPGVVKAVAPLVTAPLSAAARVAAGPVTAFTGRGGRALAPVVDELNAAALGAGRQITDLSAGDLAGSHGLQSVQATLARAPFGGYLREGAERGMQQVEARSAAEADALAAGGVAPIRDVIGQHGQSASRRAITTFEQRRQALDDAATNIIGANSPVDVGVLRGVRQRLANERAQAAESLAPHYDEALATIDRTLRDAARVGGASGPAGTVPYEAMRTLRTDLGKIIDWPKVGQQADVGIDALRQAREGVNGALRLHAWGQGGNARRALQEHDDFVTAFRTEGGPGEWLTKIADPTRDPKQVLSLLQADAAGSGRGLGMLRQQMHPDDFQTLVGGMIHDLGRQNHTNANPGGGWSPVEFAKGFSRMMGSAGTRQALSHPDLAGPVEAWRRIAQIGENMSGTRTLANTSNTSATTMVLGALGALGGAASTGNLSELGHVAGALGTGAVAARLMANPAFARWLAGTAGDAAAHGMPAVNRALGKLGAIAADADPEIGGAMREYQAELVRQLAAQRERKRP